MTTSGKCAPPSLLTHLQVEVALERVFEVDQGLEMRPAQLSPRCGDNVFCREGFGKAHHVVQVLAREASIVVGFQLSRQCGDNLLAISGPLPFQHLSADALANVPVQHRQGAVDGFARCEAEAADVTQQLLVGGCGCRRVSRGVTHSSIPSAPSALKWCASAPASSLLSRFSVSSISPSSFLYFSSSRSGSWVSSSGALGFLMSRLKIGQ